MRERALIALGLALFVALFTYPAWHGLAAGTRAATPPVEQPAEGVHCVASDMRARHPQLLLDWRDSVVRHQQDTYTTADGRNFHISLAATCLGGCHRDRQAFCDRCHAYSAVKGPYCWDCHQSGGQRVALAGDRPAGQGVKP